MPRSQRPESNRNFPVHLQAAVRVTQIDAAEANRLRSVAAYHGSCADDQQRGRAVACPLPGFQRGKLPGMPTVASPFGKGAYVPRIVWIAGAALLLAAAAIPSVLFATQEQTGTEARINAYKHEDGRIEFGMQLREGDGWGERILPRGRFLGPDSREGRWLNSTPVDLSAATPSGPYIALPIRTGDFVSTAGKASYEARYREHNYQFYTIVNVEPDGFASENRSITLEEPRLRILCAAAFGAFSGEGHEYGSFFRANVTFRGVQYNSRWYGDITNIPVYDSDVGVRFIAVNWRFPSEPRTPTETQRMTTGPEWFSDSSYISEERIQELKEYDELFVEYRDTSGNRTGARFDLNVAFSTPVQPNLDYCGEY